MCCFIHAVIGFPRSSSHHIATAVVTGRDWRYRSNFTDHHNKCYCSVVIIAYRGIQMECNEWQ